MDKFGTENQEIENFISKAEENVSMILYYIVKFVDDEIVGKFISENFSDILSKSLYFGNKIKPNKVILLKFFTDYFADNLISPYPYNMYKHLLYISACFYSYGLLSENANHKDYKTIIHAEECNKVYINHTRTALRINGKTYDFEKYNQVHNLPSLYIKEIITNIINSYYEYKFYYYFVNRTLVKVEFKTDENVVTNDPLIVEETKYDIINPENITTTYLINRNNNIKLKLNKILAKGKSVDYFKTMNQRLYDALSYKLEECTWCNPNLNNKRSERKCKSCRDLIEELDYLKYITKDENIKNFDFNVEIKKVGIDKLPDLASLRNSRRKFILDKVNPFRNSLTVNIVNEINHLAKKSFSDEIDIKMLKH